MGIKLGDNINITAGLPNDCRYQNAAVGPYTSVTQANSTVTADIRYIGLTLNINNTEYWYKDGIGDGDLVEKTSGGGAGMLNWTGSTANAIGTYMRASGICAQPNLTFDGSTLTVTGIACATTCFAGSGAGLTGTASSLTVGTAANATTATNALCLGGSAASTYVQNLSDLSITATATEINTVADGSTAKNSHVHGSVNSGGCLGTAAGCIVCTTTSGCLATITPSSMTVGTATNATTATNALCLGGSAASTYVQNLSDLSITATATEINTVADGSTAKNSHTHTSLAGLTATVAELNTVADGTTAKNSHTHDDRYYTEGESNTNFVSKVTVGTNSFTPGYLTFSDGGTTNRDFISFNDTTNAFYFNADTTHTTSAANATIHALCYCGGKAYDADRLDGLNSSTAAAASTIAARTAACDIAARLFCSTYTSTNATIGSIMTKNTTDTYIRPSTPAQIRAGVTDGYYAPLASPTFTGTLTVPIVCVTTCVRSIRTYATVCSYSPVICGTTCVRSGVICATTTFRSSALSGYVYCGGTACGTAVDWVATSDCRIKKCIEPITSALSKIDALCGVCYELCENDSKDMGLIAQDVFLVEPRLVSHQEPIEEYKKYGVEDELLSLKYDKFAGLFVEAIKEQQLQIEELKLEIKKIKDDKSI